MSLGRLFRAHRHSQRGKLGGRSFPFGEGARLQFDLLGFPAGALAAETYHQVIGELRPAGGAVHLGAQFTAAGGARDLARFT